MTQPLTPADAALRLLTLPPGACVLVLGASDTGKTTWTTGAARLLAAHGRTAAVVDTDLGQGEIGPPGTLGAALAAAGADVKTLRALPVSGAAFVGAVSPARHVPEWLAAAFRVVQIARAQSPDIVLIDTDGWTSGPAAVRAKRALVDIARPAHIVAMQKNAELEPLLSPFAHQKTPEVWRVSVPAEVGRKTPAVRSTRRAARFLLALDGAKEVSRAWNSVALVGTGLGMGETLPLHVQQFLSQSLKRPVLHAEQSAGLVYVVTHGEGWDANGLSAIEGHFGRGTAVQVAPAQKFAGLLLGLNDAQGELLGIGTLARLDFAARVIVFRTTSKRPAAITQIVFGSVRLSSNGTERGETRPGEI